MASVALLKIASFPRRRESIRREVGPRPRGDDKAYFHSLGWAKPQRELPRKTRTREFNLRSEAGFNVIELAFSLAIIIIVVVTVFEAYANAYPAFRASSSLQLLQAQLRQAREVSIDQRRSVTVTFQGTSELVAVVVGINGAANTTLFDYFLPERLSYVLLSGVPDTPDAYGNSYAVNYNCPSNTLPCTITFQSDGSVQDGSGTGSTNNGSIFIGLTGQIQTARAVTILGATGKIHGWSYNGTAWH